MGKISGGLLAVLCGLGCSDATPRDEAPAGEVSSALVPARANTIIDQWASQNLPLLDPDGNPVCELITQIYASLYRSTAINSVASYKLRQIAAAGWFPGGTSVTDASLPCKLSLPVLVRIYADVNTRARLTDLARAALADLLWNFVKDRSRLVDADPVGDTPPNPWNLVRSENIDAALKSTYYIALNSLKDLKTDGAAMGEPYTTLGQHRLAWRAFWKEYFRQHAREGLNSEYASNGYSKYSLSAYYNVRDFSGSSALFDLAEPFLHLYWADVAHDFLPSTGMRGGAKARSDKDSLDVQQEDLRPWTYMYDWHDNVPTQLPDYPAVIPATSTYRIPAIITAMASDANKPPFAYASRRPGYLTEIPIVGDVYKVGFVSGSSLQRRFTYNSPDYVFGTLNVQPRNVPQGNAGGYQNSGQRWMGAMFASSADARIAMFGLGTGGEPDLYPKRGYAEIIGAAGDNAMVVAKDPSADVCIGVRIFVSDSVWGPSDPPVSNGWHFFRSGNGYAAFRIASGSWTLAVSGADHDDGRLLALTDEWSPVAFQFGRASAYTSFEDFKNVVAARSFTFAGQTLTYVSPKNQTYTISRGETYLGSSIPSYPLPRVDGSAGLSAAKTYDSTYMVGYHEQSTVRFNYGDYPELLLNFAY
jgi:hypothetical protein